MVKNFYLHGLDNVPWTQTHLDNRYGGVSKVVYLLTNEGLI